MSAILFETEGGQRIENPEWPEIERLLSEINPREGRGYFILTNSDGSYVQAAGAKLRMTIEHRRMLGDGTFRHYVVGQPGVETGLTSINTSVGTIQLQRNEILQLRIVLPLFRSFLETGQLPGDISLRDVTDRFA